MNQAEGVVFGPHQQRGGAAVGGEVVGRVTSGTTSPTLGHPIALALVNPDAAAADAFEVEVRGKDHPASRTEIPFYKP